MKNRHIILVAFLLFNCTDNNIAPAPPDKDAASARKDFYTFSVKHEKPYALNLKKANIYFVSDGYSEDPRFPDWNYKEIVVTDGVHNPDPSIWLGDYPEDYIGETYMILFLLYSKPYDVVKAGTFKPLIGYSLQDENTGAWLYNEQVYLVYTRDYKNLHSDPIMFGDQVCPTETRIEYLAKAASNLNIQASNIAGGETVTITFNADMELFGCEWNLPALNSVKGKGTFNVSGIINADYLYTATNTGRISGNQEHMSMIMKRFNNHK